MDWCTPLPHQWRTKRAWQWLDGWIYDCFQLWFRCRGSDRVACMWRGLNCAHCDGGTCHAKLHPGHTDVVLNNGNTKLLHDLLLGPICCWFWGFFQWDRGNRKDLTTLQVTSLCFRKMWHSHGEQKTQDSGDFMTPEKWCYSWAVFQQAGRQAVRVFCLEKPWLTLAWKELWT